MPTSLVGINKTFLFLRKNLTLNCEKMGLFKKSLLAIFFNVESPFQHQHGIKKKTRKNGSLKLLTSGVFGLVWQTKITYSDFLKTQKNKTVNFDDISNKKQNKDMMRETHSTQHSCPQP